MSQPNLLGRIDRRFRSVFSYGAVVARGFVRPAPSGIEQELNRHLVGYPRNHGYRVRGRSVIPGFLLHERLRAVGLLYPKPLASFLDVGCCRGYFVLDAAMRPGCRAAVGIDVYEPFISVAGRVGGYLEIAAARFHLATLEEVSARPESFGGPFQAVLLLGTYHYLFWGSQLCPSAYRSHEAILSRLAAVCSERLIFSARLEVERLPRRLRQIAKAGAEGGEYTQARFLETAAEWFDVRAAGRLGKDALFVMSRKATDRGTMA